MNEQLVKLQCAKCKYGFIVKSSYESEIVKYKLVFCPNCNTPVREVRVENSFTIENIPITV